MKGSRLTTTFFASLAIVFLVSATAFPQSSGAPSPAPGGMMGGPNMMGSGQNMMSSQGMMGGGQGMMAGMPMMAMPMCAGMMAGSQDPKTIAKMLQMHAEMMRSNAAIMEKYARQLETAK